MSCCGTWQGQFDLLTLAISSPLCSQFPCQSSIYQSHHQSLIFLHLILSLPLHLLGFTNIEENWLGDVKLDVDFISLSMIIFQLGSLVSFPSSILHSNGIKDLATPISLNSTKLSHRFLFPPLNVSRVN